jgi:hypothetical protein
MNPRRIVGSIVFGTGALAVLGGTYTIVTSSGQTGLGRSLSIGLGLLTGAIGLPAIPLGAWLLSGRSGLPLFGSIAFVAGLFALFESVDPAIVPIMLACTAAAFWMGRGRRGVSGWLAIVAGFVAGVLLGDLLTLSVNTDPPARSPIPQPAWQIMFVASLAGTAALTAAAYALGHGRAALRWPAGGTRERLKLFGSAVVLAAVVLASTALLGASAAVLPTDAQVVRVEVREDGLTASPESIAAGDVHIIIRLRARSQVNCTFDAGSLSEIGFRDLAEGRYPQSSGAYLSVAHSYTMIFDPGDRDEQFWANPQTLQPGRYAFICSFSGPPHNLRWAVLVVT